METTMQTKPRFFLLFAATLLALTTACGNGNNMPGDGDGDGDITGDGDGDIVAPEDAPVALDDVVDLGDLITQEMDASSAAAQLGDPAEILAVAQQSGENIRSHVTSVLDRVQNITDREPDATGETPAGRPFGVWEGTQDDVQWRFTAVRINERRVRYLLTGKLTSAAEDAPRIPVLTGIFVRDPDWAPRKGGGRFHLNMTGLTNLGRGPNLDGQIHFVFANKDADRRGRRVFYRNIRERGAMELPANYAADLIRHVGVGGRMRSVFLGDVLTGVPGRELYAMRTAWRAGEGGRGAAAIASYNAGDPILLGTAHECWDTDGLRTFYANTYAADDDVNPNDGNPEDCVQLLPEEAAPEADPDGEDLDEELTEILDESGANDVSEEDAAEENGDVQ
jgi:hypothetical protein